MLNANQMAAVYHIEQGSLCTHLNMPTEAGNEALKTKLEVALFNGGLILWCRPGMFLGSSSEQDGCMQANKWLWGRKKDAPSKGHLEELHACIWQQSYACMRSLADLVPQSASTLLEKQTACAELRLYFEACFTRWCRPKGQQRTSDDVGASRQARKVATDQIE